MPKKRRNSFFLLLILLLIVIELTENNANAGNLASYTRNGWIGAEHVAMGKAVEVIVDDVYSIYWNPAGLRELEDREGRVPDETGKEAIENKPNIITDDDLIIFSEGDGKKNLIQLGVSAAILDAEKEAGFIGMAFNSWGGVLGFGLYSVQARDKEFTDISPYPFKKFDALSSAGYISYGIGLGVASIGLSVKALYEKIGHYGFYGLGGDLGVQVELIPFVKVGLVIQDIGTGLKPDEDYDHIDNEYDFSSPVIKLSAAITGGISDLVISFTGIKEMNDDYEFNYGFQYDILKYSSIYLGVNDYSIFSCGFSFRLFDAELSYAFSYDREEKGYDNTISLTYEI